MITTANKVTTPKKRLTTGSSTTSAWGTRNEAIILYVLPHTTRLGRKDCWSVSQAHVDEDGCIVISGQRIPPGSEVLVRGRRGRFRYKTASVSSTGRVVVDTIGPIGIHQAFRSFHLEDIKSVPQSKKPRGVRRVV